MSFKALITFHKVVKDGHPLVLKDAISERVWLQTLSRGTQIMTNKGKFIYSQINHFKVNASEFLNHQSKLHTL